MKKFLAILLSVMLVLAFSTVALAATITVDNAVNGEVYSAYKIFDATGTVSGGVYEQPASGSTYDSTAGITYYEADANIPGTYNIVTGLSNGDDVSDYYVLKSGVSYTIPATINNATNPWYTVVSNYANAADTTDADGLTLTPSAGDPNVYVVSIDESKFSAQDFAEALKTALDGAAAGTYTADGTQTASGGSAAISVTDPGYYFIDTSLGSLCALDTAATTATVKEKNTQPTVVKEISDDGTTYGAGPIDVDMGDTVYYKVTVTDGRGTDTAITVHDQMEAGLTFDASTLVVKKGNTTLTAGTDYTVNTSPSDSCTFEVVLNAATVAGLDTGDTVEITFQAVLNAAAEIYYNSTIGDTNDNTAWLTYSNQTSTQSTVQTKTYEFELIKTDNSTPAVPLQGVKFTLTKTESGTTYYYTPAVDTTDANTGAVTTSSVWQTTDPELETDANGIIDFKGLDAGTYILTETETLAGYNLLTNTITVTIASDGTVTAVNTSDSTTVTVTDAADNNGTVTPANFTIINSQGSMLPSTGGIGTTIFYIVGAILVLGAGILIIAKRRSSATAEQ